ncbi:MAG: phosphoribosylformylglycinamidine synthase subunit PurQ [Bacteroidetes bacterium]|nr:phosphoribosylformylglycinamidine synthase subunit PurQ [Bacteroidota bacterium]
MSQLHIGVVQFPGSNCDHDAVHAWQTAGQKVSLIWHKNSDLEGADVIFLPGGFSYGDYLRCGAIAKYSPVMKEVVRFANQGGLVIGVCNGFQILLEAGLLPGVMLPNQSLKFICRQVNLKVVTRQSSFTSAYQEGQVIRVPVAHGEGNYFADEDTLKSLQDHHQILFQYCESDGSVTDSANINGSMLNIAGIMSKSGNVLGMMPHPERAVESVLGSQDGLGVFQSVLNSFAEKAD